MKAFVSNDNTSSHCQGQGGLTVKVEPSTHSLAIHAEISWEAVEILDTVFLMIGEVKKHFEARRFEDKAQGQIRADNDNVYEKQRKASIEDGMVYANELDELRKADLDRNSALAEIANAHGVGIKHVEVLIKVYRRHIKSERMARTKILMKAGRTAKEIGDDIGVSRSQAHRFMQAVEGGGQ